MMIWVIVIAIAVLIVAIWGFLELKAMKHKILAIFLITVLLFAYLSFTLAFNGKDIDFTSIDGLNKAVKIYFSWFGNAFNNVKTITARVINMNWQGNRTT